MKKIGHTGTLDPEAEGVLPVCLGKGTKLVDLITDKDKTYEAVMKLGLVTDTQDLTGQVLKRKEVTAGLPEITAAIKSFIGGYDQLPPMYSAIKINGKKLYELARQGKEIERSTRRVTIGDIRLLHYSEETHEVTVSVDCGKGTYIRTLLHDIGDALGCGGAMKSLVRTRVGSFLLKDALRLSEVEELTGQQRLSEHIVPVDELFIGYKKIIIGKEYDRFVHNGNAFPPEYIEETDYAVNRFVRNVKPDTPNLAAGGFDRISGQDEPVGAGLKVRVYDAEQEFIGIYRFDPADGIFHPVKMFL